MEFKQPELLYALFLLLIPLAVHFFQLRRFQKEDFTNVKFLKKVISQTRKSSRIKKWLILVTRMLLFGALILAFGQPFFPAEDPEAYKSEKVIFLDNSYSMQATGKNGELLAAAVQDIIKNLPENEEINLLTHDREFRKLSAEDLAFELQNLDFAENTLDFSTIKLKAQQILTQHRGKKDMILISDFQENLEILNVEDTSGLHYHFIPLEPENTANISLDSVYISNRETEMIKLEVLLSSTTNFPEPVSVAAYDGQKLLARTAVNFDEKKTANTEFSIASQTIGKGSIQIEDASLAYDNRLYFSVNELKPAEVIILSENSEANFIKRILISPEFNTENFEVDKLDFNRLNAADLIILNELKEISGALRSNLTSLKNKGAKIIIIPSENAVTDSFKDLLGSLDAPDISTIQIQENLITQIAFDHPLLRDVFAEPVVNFDYPTVHSFYPVNSGNNILTYQDNSGFLIEQNELYLFTAALNTENSNFKNSPLIVPVFYNIGASALKTLPLYYQGNFEEQIQVSLSTQQDRVLHLVSEGEDFIPRQRVLGDNLEFTINELEITPGNYILNYQGESKGFISINSPRTETQLKYTTPKEKENSKLYTSISSYFNELKASGKSRELWKCFVIFALIFLTAEMLLLKYLK